MTRVPFIAYSELTNEIYIVAGKEKYRVTEQAIKAVIATKALEKEDILDKIDEIITDALDKSTDQKESQTLRWVLDKISEVM
jgi:hypothetical protein